MSYIRLDNLRKHYSPQIPKVLETLPAVEIATNYAPIEESVSAFFPATFGLPLLELKEPTSSEETQERIPLTVGVLLSGGQAPGGHNVIAGIFDALKSYHPASSLYGFLMGPGGLLKKQVRELTADVINAYRNSGGFDMIGSDRTKLEKKEDFATALKVAHSLGLDALVIIGGDDSNTNAALLAEYCQAVGDPLVVVGCPKTIDGDLKNAWIETSFGFDTCAKVYAELIGNIQRDCYSSKKYWHFIKLMGRSASHLTLECALLTQPNVAIISEEIAAHNRTLNDIVTQLADVIVMRSERGMDFGSVLIPEGLVEFVPRMKALIVELNKVLAENAHKLHLVKRSQILNYLAGKLTEESASFFLSLPKEMAYQLSMERDPHGNVQVSRIETEELIVTMLKKELDKRKAKGEYKGKFSALTHFFGYEGRCSMPSNFDASYCYALGRTATYLAVHRRSGYMASVRNLVNHPSEWQPAGIPLTLMMHLEERKGMLKAVIKKSLVDIEGAPFRYFRKHRHEWAEGIAYHYPGPIQYFGPSAVCDNTTLTLRLENHLEPEDETYDASSLF
ncbi:diphosphate--fructose-6-phosphate 1-phosphotransferase [Porphyromonas gingivicanis]|uniref:diphosphate--fructose-6-phosphate 1-phosphotransferase n=1 Tax=Porphyromonas gingivicanis TaxID=266762 RepID=UPI00046FF222|nr:diphosphate--fructose-6-phosphate 1-phosphotransferase [Porphyromonas gingivicanis]